MDSTEAAAKAVIEAVLSGARMQFRTDQSHSVPDFDLTYADGTVAAVEATGSVDRQRLQTQASIRKHGHFVARRQARNDWLVLPARSANIKLIHEHVDEYLAAIEGDGLTHFHSYTDADDYPSVDRILADLNIEGGGLVPWKSPGIAIGGVGWTGMVRAEHAQAAVEAEANKPDNRRKLGTSGRAARHLFVHIDSSNSQAWVAIRDLDPPPSPPTLPPEITDVWAAAVVGSMGAWIVWRGSNRGWEKLGLIQAS